MPQKRNRDDEETPEVKQEKDVQELKEMLKDSLEQKVKLEKANADALTKIKQLQEEQRKAKVVGTWKDLYSHHQQPLNAARRIYPNPFLLRDLDQKDDPTTVYNGSDPILRSLQSRNKFGTHEETLTSLNLFLTPVSSFSEALHYLSNPLKPDARIIRDPRQLGEDSFYLHCYCPFPTKEDVISDLRRSYVILGVEARYNQFFQRHLEKLAGESEISNKFPDVLPFDDWWVSLSRWRIQSREVETPYINLFYQNGAICSVGNDDVLVTTLRQDNIQFNSSVEVWIPKPHSGRNSSSVDKDTRVRGKFDLDTMRFYDSKTNRELGTFSVIAL